MAIYDPLSVPNNKYGIHIIDENDLNDAANLVNSTGGDWGYVTFVITENDRDLLKWQTIFDKLSNLHLIPIVRLATHLENNSWVKPNIKEAQIWADFLTNLYWVVKNRYIVLFNEPNHAKEWGGSVNPKEYADICEAFQKSLKEKSSDFFILPAGLDASAPNSNETMDEKDFLKEIIEYKNSVLENFDGWTSHSYPNPGFIGNVGQTGKGTLESFKWELSYLKLLGIVRSFPVFITETGWPHFEGIINDKRYLNSNLVALNFQKAMESVWNDSEIVAVTPFLLNYQSFPFANFSWRKINSNEYYSQYNSYQLFPKTEGKPQFLLIDTNQLYKSFNLLSDIKMKMTSLKDFFQLNKSPYNI